MALVLANRVRETSTTTGTGTITLAGAVTGYQTFSAGIGANNTCYYTISNPGVAEWEVGLGTVGSPATTLARTTILASSNAGSAVNFSAGTKDVFVTYPSSKSVYLDASGNASALGTPASGTVTNLTGTASININGTVGATTPNTGAFTTLSTTGAVTFTGTNQATTLGTAGTSTEASALYLEGGTGTGGGGGVQFQKNGTLAGAVGMTSRLLGGTTSNMAYYAAAGLGHNWYANGNVTVASPNMSLTSTGLAVTGTGSFSGAISVTAAAISTFRNDQNTDTQVYIRNDSAGAAATARFDLFTGTGTDRALTLASFGPGYTGSYAGVNYANLRYISDNAAAANSNGLMLTSASKNVYIAPAATLVGTFSSTGLAVTGTLSVTDTISSTKNGALFTKTGGTVNAQWFQIANNNNSYVGVESSAGGAIFTGSTAYAAVWGSASNYPAEIYSNNAKVAAFSSTGLAVTGTLYSSGNFYSGGVANGQTPDATHAGQAITISNQMYNSAGATSADSVLIRFINTNGLVGTINVSGSATAYNTSSDQRLKEDLGISTDVSVLQNLKIHDFKWKVDGSQDRGVFAQEAYQVKPSAIRVGSDDIDEYGHLEKPWSADYSKFVPDLIVGWKNHEDRIARLEAALANAGISLQ